MAERQESAADLRKQIAAFNKSLSEIRAGFKKGPQDAKSYNKMLEDVREGYDDQAEAMRKLITQQMALGKWRQAEALGAKRERLMQAAGGLPGGAPTGFLSALDKAGKAIEGGVSGFIRALPAGAALLVGFNLFRTMFDHVAGLNKTIADISLSAGTLGTEFQLSAGEVATAITKLIKDKLVVTGEEAEQLFSAAVREIPGFAEEIKKGGRGLTEFITMQKAMNLSSGEFASIQGRYNRTLRDDTKARVVLAKLAKDAQGVAKDSEISTSVYAREVMQASEALKGFQDIRLIPGIVKALADTQKVVGDQLGEAAAGLAGAGDKMSTGVAAWVGMLGGEKDPLLAIARARMAPAEAGINVIKRLAEGMGGIAMEGPELTKQAVIFREMLPELTKVIAPTIPAMEAMLMKIRDGTISVENLDKEIERNEEAYKDGKDLMGKFTEANKEATGAARGLTENFTNLGTRMKNFDVIMEETIRNAETRLAEEAARKVAPTVISTVLRFL